MTRLEFLRYKRHGGHFSSCISEVAEMMQEQEARERLKVVSPGDEVFVRFEVVWSCDSKIGLRRLDFPDDSIHVFHKRELLTLKDFVVMA